MNMGCMPPQAYAQQVEEGGKAVEGLKAFLKNVRNVLVRAGKATVDDDSQKLIEEVSFHADLAVSHIEAAKILITRHNTMLA